MSVGETSIDCSNCGNRHYPRFYGACEHCLRSSTIKDSWTPIVIIGKCTVCGGPVEQENEYHTLRYEVHGGLCSEKCAAELVRRLGEKYRKHF